MSCQVSGNSPSLDVLSKARNATAISSAARNLVFPLPLLRDLVIPTKEETSYRGVDFGPANSEETSYRGVGKCST